MEKLIECFTDEEDGEEYEAVSKCKEKCLNGGKPSCNCEPILEIRRKLFQYESTGLEPDEIPQLQEKYDTAIKALSGAILEKAEIPQWVPCSEKLPKISDEYLVLTENGDMFNANFDKDYGDNGEFGEWQDRYDEHTLGFLDSEWSSYGGITHWQPLPQPQKGKKQ